MLHKPNFLRRSILRTTLRTRRQSPAPLLTKRKNRSCQMPRRVTIHSPPISWKSSQSTTNSNSNSTSETSLKPRKTKWNKNFFNCRTKNSRGQESKDNCLPTSRQNAKLLRNSFRMQRMSSRLCQMRPSKFLRICRKIWRQSSIRFWQSLSKLTRFFLASQVRFLPLWHQLTLWPIFLSEN